MWREEAERRDSAERRLTLARELWDWEPHAAQKVLFCGVAQVKVAACGRRWGKTECLSVDTATLALDELRHGRACRQLIVAPTEAQARLLGEEVLRRLQEALAQKRPDLEGVKAVVRRKPGLTVTMTVTLTKPGAPAAMLWCRTAGLDGAGLRGLWAHRIIVDEAAWVPDAVLSDVLWPMLADKGGEYLLASSPFGRRSGFYRLWTRGRGGPDKEAVAGGVTYASFQFPTGTNPHLDRAFLDAQREELGETAYAQEFCHLGSTLVGLTDGSKRAFRDLRIGDHIWYNDSISQTAMPCRIVNKRQTGVKPIVTVTTEIGTLLSASADHRVVSSVGKTALETAPDLHYVHAPRYSAEQQLALARVVGYNIGDGNITLRRHRYVKKDGTVSLYGAYFQAAFYALARPDLTRLAQDIAASGLMGEAPNTTLKKGRTAEGDTYQIQITGGAADRLREAGCPAGAKVEIDFPVPAWIQQGSQQFKAEFLAALWGAEGSTPRQQTGKAKQCKMPVLTMLKSRREDGIAFFEQVAALHQDLEVQVALKISQEKRRWRFALYIKSDVANTQRFFERIGYRYASNKERLAFLWGRYYAAYLFETRSRYARAASLRASGASLRQIASDLGCCTQQALNIIRRGVSQPWRSFPTFAEWTEPRWRDNGVYVRIVERSTSDPQAVYNITVDSPDHSYLLADGLNNYNCAEFVDDGGAVFRQEDIDGAIQADPRVRREAGGLTSEPVPGRYYTMGVDWARKQDFTVACVLDATERPARLVRLARWRNVSWEAQAQDVAGIVARFRPRRLRADGSSVGDAVGDMLDRAIEVACPEGAARVEQFLFSAGSKQRLIDGLTMGLSAGALTFPPHPALVAELRAFEYGDGGGSGRAKMAARGGGHDDCVIALALAWSLVPSAAPPPPSQCILLGSQADMGTRE